MFFKYFMCKIQSLNLKSDIDIDVGMKMYPVSEVGDIQFEKYYFFYFDH